MFGAHGKGASVRVAARKSGGGGGLTRVPHPGECFKC